MTNTAVTAPSPWSVARSADSRLRSEEYDHSGHTRRCAPVVTVYRDTYGTPTPGTFGRGWQHIPVPAFTVLHVWGSRRSSLGFTLYQVAVVGADGRSYAPPFEIGNEYMIDIDAGCRRVTVSEG